MAHLHRPHVVSRRGFLTDIGRGTVAVTLLGTAVACSDDNSNASADPSTTTAGGTDDADDTADEDRIDLWYERADFEFVSAYVLARDGMATIVDTGTGDLGPIEAALTAANSGFDRVSDVVLTHLHGDHIGGLDVLAEATRARFHAGEADVAGIDTDVDLRALVDGDDVAGLQIIATPGHTAGHVSVFDPVSGILVAGDALNLGDGTLAGSAPQFTADQAAADASVRKLSDLGVRTILAGHGDPLEGTGGSALDDLAATL